MKTPKPTDIRCPECRGALWRDTAGAGRLSEHMGRIVLQCVNDKSHRWSVVVPKDK